MSGCFTSTFPRALYLAPEQVLKMYFRTRRATVAAGTSITSRSPVGWRKPMTPFHPLPLRPYPPPVGRQLVSLLLQLPLLLLFDSDLHTSVSPVVHSGLSHRVRKSTLSSALEHSSGASFDFWGCPEAFIPGRLLGTRSTLTFQAPTFLPCFKSLSPP